MKIIKKVEVLNKGPRVLPATHRLVYVFKVLFECALRNTEIMERQFGTVEDGGV